MPLKFNFPDVEATLSITAHKAVRVKNDKNVHLLPDSRGELEFFQLGNQRFAPINHKDQAMWLAFSNLNSNSPIAIKVLAGGLNTITGEKETEDTYPILRNSNAEGKKQNYMIVPGQPWLDGFLSKDGAVRQFVAVPLGEGRSIEEKLEGTQRGGIQFVVIPIKKNVYEEKLAEIRKQLALASEREQALIEQAVKQIQEQLILLDDPTLTQHQKDAVKTEIRIFSTSLPYNHPLVTTLSFKYGISSDLEPCCSADMQSRKSRGPGKILSGIAEMLSSIPKMGLAGGGLITQDIFASTISIDDFDTQQSKYMEFDLINLEAHRKMNKLPQPPRPLTEDEYTNAGGLWFELLSSRPTVKIDEASRLGALEQSGNISAFPQETPAVPVPASQFKLLGEHGLFNNFTRGLRAAITPSSRPSSKTSNPMSLNG